MAPDANDPCLFPVAELSRLISSRRISPVELVRSFLDRIHRIDGHINSYITLLEDEAVKEAREAQEAIARGGYLGPLHGIPVAIKDLIDTSGIRTTYGSKLMAEHVPV